VINPESAGKERTQLARGVVLAVRELLLQSDTGNQALDLAAFIALSLDAISKTVDPSVEAWEKRGYWVKADQFRMEWAWADRLSHELKLALTASDWARVAQAAVQIAQKLSAVKLPQRHRLGAPWVGAWARLNKKG
jgi:hypothetical protein